MIDAKRCVKCGIRQGTINFEPNPGMAFYSMTHGGAQLWCELCVVRANLEYAEKQEARIPELKRRLRALEDA